MEMILLRGEGILQHTTATIIPRTASANIALGEINLIRIGLSVTKIGGSQINLNTTGSLITLPHILLRPAKGLHCLPLTIPDLSAESARKKMRQQKKQKK